MQADLCERLAQGVRLVAKEKVGAERVAGDFCFSERVFEGFDGGYEFGLVDKGQQRNAHPGHLLAVHVNLSRERLPPLSQNSFTLKSAG